MKKFKKFLMGICAASVIFSVSSIKSAAEFDANYYARKYPDVVKVLGNDPKVLENHYNTCGIKEGRFGSQKEETEKYLGLLNSDNKVTVDPAPATTPQTQVTAPVTNEATPTVTILPGYSTYIDVNIAAQTVTYFENGNVKLQSPCVTGNPNGHSTPTGTWTVMCKVPGKYLVGPTWKCWVDRWMQFTPSHCGFHDASWRSEFGGAIYQTNGSHGCVNLPKDVANSLYDMISVGTTVVVH